MKRGALLSYTFLLLAFTGGAVQAQQLFSIGNTAISKQEFLRAFNKNNQNRKPTAAAVREYLELFIRFKLKVKEAYAQRLDTLPNQVTELKDFRDQVAANYLKDNQRFEELLHQAFERSQRDIHLSHLFIPLTDATLPIKRGETPDTTNAFRRAQAAYHDLQRGLDFGSLLNKYSTDSAAKAAKGDIGFVTVFTLPYDIENLVYALPVGAVSRPLRIGGGYHLFKNTGVRPAAGRLRLRQVLLSVPPAADETQMTSIHRKADSIYQALSSGEPFEKVTERFSNASLTSGELPEFGVGTYQPAFERAAFTLENNGSVARPIQTTLGIHILQRIDRLPVNTDESNEPALDALRQRLMGDRRMEIARRQMLVKVNRLVQLRTNKINAADLGRYADSALRGTKPAQGLSIQDNTPLFSIAGKTYPAGEWIKLLKSGNQPPAGAEAYQALLQRYQDDMALNHYRDNLENYEPEFAAQVKEFKEGNLLFEIMQRTLWDKAAADTVALKKFYDEHAENYWWQPGAEAVIFNCTDSLTAFSLHAALKRDPRQWRSLLAPHGEKVQADSGRFELAQLQLASSRELVAGTISSPNRTSADNTAYQFAYLIRSYPEKLKRGFDDARGFVINDYQGFLETEWIQSLKARYPVKVQEAVVKTLY